jgi:hypothetical protein
MTAKSGVATIIKNRIRILKEPLANMKTGGGEIYKVSSRCSDESVKVQFA